MSSEDELDRRLELLEERIGRQERKFGVLVSTLTLILTISFVIALPALPAFLLFLGLDALLFFIFFPGIVVILLILTIFQYTGRRSDRVKK